MLQATLERIKLFLEKMGTILADRRFWMAILTVGVSLLTLTGIDGNTIDKIKALIGEDGAAAATFAEALIGALIVVITGIKTISSWTERPPSGLDYKELDKASAFINDYFGKKD